MQSGDPASCWHSLERCQGTEAADGDRALICSAPPGQVSIDGRVRMRE